MIKVNKNNQFGNKNKKNNVNGESLSDSLDNSRGLNNRCVCVFL